MQIIRRTARALTHVVGAVLILMLAAAFLPTLLGYESFIVSSGSMGRAMPTGSIAVTRMVDVDAIAVGDIVTFRHEGADVPTTHRVISIDHEPGQRVVATKGDGNAKADPKPLVLRDGAIARVQWVVPLAGYVVAQARTPLGGVVLFLLPILGLVSDRRRRVAATDRAVPPVADDGAHRTAPGAADEATDTLEPATPFDHALAGWSVTTAALAGMREQRPLPAPLWLMPAAANGSARRR